MAKLILRVDDCGWVPPDKHNDVDLTYFRKWREALHTHDLPVYLGFIPTTVTDNELRWLRDNLKPNEELAVHGYDHARGARVTDVEMHPAQLWFSRYAQTRTYIPPFNDYHDGTIRDWGRVTDGKLSAFFGGFRNEHYHGPDHPFAFGGTYVLPAYRHIYGRASELLQQLPDWLDLQCPLTVTLHATWDCDQFAQLGELHDLLAPHLTTIDCIPQYIKSLQLNSSRLTGAHWMAYQLVLPHITVSDDVLDFGSRYSVLPSHMMLRGARVVATDRDPKLAEYQADVAASFGLRAPQTVYWDGRSPLPEHGNKHVITSCWAIQHNLEPGEIEAIAANMGSMLRPSGKLLFVCSFSPDKSYAQTDRADPQLVLNRADHLQRIVAPSGCTLEDWRTFRYVHGTITGYECAEHEANAVFYVLRK